MSEKCFAKSSMDLAFFRIMFLGINDSPIIGGAVGTLFGGRDERLAVALSEACVG